MERGSRHLFIVGCPRSGTTWMQLLLAQHPDVVTSQESHLFLTYLRPIMRAWEKEGELPPGRRRVGLSSVLDRDEFRAACLAFTDAVFEPIIARRPAARLIVEKSPGHSLVAAQILDILPDADFLHVIRDPREVVCSLRAAGRSWGMNWAPDNVTHGARLWSERVKAGLSVAGLTRRYVEVRYEELARDAAGVLARVCDFLRLPIDADFCRDAADACRIDRLRRPGDGAGLESPWQLDGEPDGFFRQGRTEGWRDELTKSEVRRIEHVVSPLMADLGYEPETAPGRRRPARLALREGLRWRLDRLYERCNNWVDRL